MVSQLVVIHRPRQGGPEQVFSNHSDWILWETCVRRIAIGIKENVSDFEILTTDERYESSSAYRFLLEVVCGLRSPVRGETEVHGQFRALLEKIGDGHPLFKLLQNVSFDARKVRAAHLQGLGSQSYGSLARRKARTSEVTRLAMFGAGPLAREILPWVAKLSIPVDVYVRQPERHSDLEEKFEGVTLRAFDSQHREFNGLLVAAPVSSGFIADWLGSRDVNLKLVLDYRGESHSDRLRVPGAYFSLEDIFREIENTKQKVDAEVDHALRMIASLCE